MTLVEQIYSKAMTKWHDRQASAMIENDIAEMKRILKGKIFEAKLANSEFTAT